MDVKTEANTKPPERVVLDHSPLRL